MTTTSELRLLCGVGTAIGDTQSEESALRVLDLLNAGVGFSVDVFGWSPALPQLKGGGSWADSALVDGRALIAGTVNNVVETITLTAQGATAQGRFALERVLADFARLAREFWTTEAQIEPVYLRWKASGACYEQYALVYNIDIAPDGDPFANESSQALTITVEREPYWRAVPPGANPKLFTFQFAGLQPGLQFDVDDLSLWRDIDHLAYGVVDNRHEWDPTDYVSTLSRNYIDIPAERIPGDAPALCYLTIRGLRNMFIARSTKKTLYTNRLGETYAAAATLNAGDARISASGDVTKDVVADPQDGAFSNGSSSSRYRVRIILSSNPDQETLIWGQNVLKLDVNTYRGKYAFFCRSEKSEIGAVDEISLQLSLRMTAKPALASYDIHQLVTLPEVKTSSEDFAFALLYLGTAEIPFDTRSISSPDGYGLEVNTHADETLEVRLKVSRESGTSVLDVLDVIMLPYDEALAEMRISFNTLVGPAGDRSMNAIDNTGYSDHGRGDWNGKQYLYDPAAGTIIGGGVSSELRGTPITLLPGVDNRLYFLGSYVDPDGTFPDEVKSDIRDSYEVRVNIVPRWSGVRDDCYDPWNGVAHSILTDDDDSYLTDDDDTLLEDG